WHCFRRSGSFSAAALVAGLVAAITAHVVETQTGIAIVSTLTYFWMILALLVVIARRPEILGLAPARPSLEVAPVAGGAPPPARAKRPQRRPADLSAPSQPLRNDGRPATRRGLFIVAYVGLIGVVVIVMSALAETGVVGAQGMMYASFLLVMVGIS